VKVRVKSFILYLIFILAAFSFTGCDIETSESINAEIDKLETEIADLKRKKAQLAVIKEEIAELEARLAATKAQIKKFENENPKVLEYIRSQSSEN
jgi:septal ring factor EnvC (AmiA/AmiB activator)